MRLPVGRGAAADARQAVRDAMASESSEQEATAILLASELVTNAVMHSGLSAPDTIGFDLVITEGTLRVSVSDDGPGFEKRDDAQAAGQGGLGLTVVDRLSDRWGVNREGANEVWFELDLHG